MTMRVARSLSFADPVRTSTIRLPYVLPIRTIGIVVSMFSTSFVAVPAFMRVEPAMTSGPTCGRDDDVASARSVPGRHVTSTRRARDAPRARQRAAHELGDAAGRYADHDVALRHA